MKRNLVYDLPTRVFHWFFAGLFVCIFVIAKFLGDKSQFFPYHMILGLTLVFLVVCRIVWGFIGTRHAKFENFPLRPKALINYLSGIRRGDKTKWAGHNPASSWAAIVMMALGLLSGTTGSLMALGKGNELLEEIHEISAYSFLAVALIHIAGIFLHTLRHKELIGLSMIDGKKKDVSDSEIISSSQKTFGVLLALVVPLFGFYLNKNYDKQSGRLEVFGQTLQLKEDKEKEKEGRSKGEVETEEHEYHEKD